MVNHQNPNQIHNRNSTRSQPQPKITTYDLTVKEPILYDLQLSKIHALPKGKKTKVQNHNGERLPYIITYRRRETGRESLKTVIKPAIDEVIRRYWRSHHH